MHIGAALVFDPLPGGGTPAIGEVREHLEQRLDLLPRYRQKLDAPRTGGLAWPSWERDQRFEIDAHVRHAALPSPGDEPEFLDWISDSYSHRLDRGRPLWEIVLLDGLAGGRWALVPKTHSGARAVFVEDAEPLAKVRAVEADLPALEFVMVIDPPDADGSTISLATHAHRARSRSCAAATSSPDRDERYVAAESGREHRTVRACGSR
jgi:wax ester synthase-like acyl-CoA acyltransferase family protein